jgi:sortase (surface protein transpeptidase)
MKKFLFILMIFTVIFTFGSVAININSISKSAAAAKSKAPQKTPSISIESIGMNNQKIQYATIKKINDLYSKMRQTPIVESNYAPDLCTKEKNSYIMGHSEPSYFGEAGTGLYAFSRLEEVEIGDIISVTNIQGQACKYKATAWDFVRTDNQDKITKEQFNKLFYPKNGGKSTLTLQTCQKGSSTIRLILRAEMI